MEDQKPTPIRSDTNPITAAAGQLTVGSIISFPFVAFGGLLRDRVTNKIPLWKDFPGRVKQDLPFSLGIAAGISALGAIREYRRAAAANDFHAKLLADVAATQAQQPAGDFSVRVKPPGETHAETLTARQEQPTEGQGR